MLLHHVTNSLLPSAFASQDEQFERAFAVLKSGIERRAFPGALVAVAQQGKLIAHKALGRFTYEFESPQVTQHTIYDLASLTKVLATTAACMLLYARGLLRPEQRMNEILPDFGRDEARKREITFRMLLTHSSGLPAYVKLFETARNREELLQQAAACALAHEPGTHAEYSDIGFILLGEALERITGEPLDEFCRREIFLPLRLQTMLFNPAPELLARIPPSEDDHTFRRQLIRGVVNDENAWVLRGVSGHAGLFSTALDVAVFAECMLRGGAPLLDLHTVEVFTRREADPPGTCWALGWDTPSPPSQSGRYFSPGSYGHLGFTGTSLWIDPQRHLSVTLLTNRTWPDRSSQAIKQIRPAFHDAVIEALK
ncbi:MAG TPA: serine hydrolase [Candidatus Angelobacter sp.]|nr:serine hydrolase [Candidatus Angelobacter sp.]